MVVRSFCLNEKKHNMFCSSQCETCKSIDVAGERAISESHSGYTRLMVDVNNDIYKERERQNRKWGYQRHSHEMWHVIASEECGEVAQAIQTFKGQGKSTDAQDLYTECLHASAVYAAFAEQVLEEMREKAKRLP